MQVCLEGRRKSDIKLTTPIKFKYQCLPNNPDLPYEESHPEISGTGETVLGFMKNYFNMSTRHFIALSVVHSAVKRPQPNQIGTKYTRFRNSYISNVYHKMIANKPMYWADRGGDVTFVDGDNPLQ